MATVGWPNWPLNAENEQSGGSQLPANLPPTPQPTPRLPSKRLKLESVQDCRRQLAILFREARRGELPTQTASRLAYLLDLMSRMIERSDLEARVIALEEAKSGKR